MRARERRRYEMLLRVRDFGNTHRHMFPASSAAEDAFDAVNAAVDELTATAMRKMSAAAAARADRKAAARTALVRLLASVSELARVLRAQGRTMPPFALPVSRGDQALATAGRQFAEDATSFDADFNRHGMSPARIADAVAAFENARRDRWMGVSDGIGARARIQVVLTSALLDVRRLDLIVKNTFAADNVMQAVWEHVRVVHSARTASAEAAPEPAVVAAAPAESASLPALRLVSSAPEAADLQSASHGGHHAETVFGGGPDDGLWSGGLRPVAAAG